MSAKSLYDEICQHEHVYMTLYLTISADEIIEDQITELPTSQLERSSNPDHALYVFGYPGPDILVFTREDFGHTWAYDKQVLIDNNQDTHTENNLMRHHLVDLCKRIGYDSLYPGKYSYNSKRILVITKGCCDSYQAKCAVYNKENDMFEWIPDELSKKVLSESTSFSSYCNFIDNNCPNIESVEIKNKRMIK